MRSLGPALGGMLLMAAVMGVGRFAYTPLLPPMMAQLPLSAAEAGAVAAANFAGYLVGALLAFLPRLPGGPRLVARLALGGSVLTTALVGAAGDAAVIAALRFAAGLASALAMICATALVTAASLRAGRPWAVSLHFAGVGLGIAASAPVALAAGAVAGDWRVGWLACACLAAVLAVPAGLLLPAVPTASAGGGARRRPPLALVSAYGLFGAGYVVSATFLVAGLRQTGAGPGLEAVAWSVVGIAAAPSALLWTRLARRIGSRAALAASCALAAAGSLAGAVPAPAFLGLAGLALGATFVGITALGLQAAREETPGADPRRITAVMTVAFGCGQIVGPLAGGLLADLTGGFGAAMAAAGVGLLLAAALAATSAAPSAGR